MTISSSGAVGVWTAHSGVAASRRTQLLVVVRRSLLLATLAVVLAAIHIRRPPTFCVLRATTGVPCPFCGGTTAVVRLGTGEWRGAITASPLALLMLSLAPGVGVVRWPWMRHRAIGWTVITVSLVLSEIWQLNRFGFL